MIVASLSISAAVVPGRTARSDTSACCTIRADTFVRLNATQFLESGEIILTDDGATGTVEGRENDFYNIRLADGTMIRRHIWQLRQQSHLIENAT